MLIVFPLLVLTYIVIMFFSFSPLGLNNELSCELIGVCKDVVVELEKFVGLMCYLTLPLTLRNLLETFHVLGQTTENKGTPKIRTRKMRTRGDHTRDIPEEDLIPSFAESEACESSVQNLTQNKFLS